MEPFSLNGIEAAFIDGHWRYGGLIHQKAAEALIAALGSVPSEPETGHALFSRLFGEYAGALETYGAWAWALREREGRGLFLEAYLDYRNQDVGNFYSLVRDHEGNLTDLLRFPPEQRILEAVTRRSPELGLTREVYRQSIEARYASLKQAADHYFAEDRVAIDTYNKTKHGATMIRLFEPENPRRFEVLMRNRSASEEGQAPYQFASFEVNRTAVQKYMHNIGVLTCAIRDLASLTKILHDADVLYPREGEATAQS